MKKISVIIPCFNAVEYLDKCMTSIIEQTIGVDSLEIITVNDASTDHTYQKLLEWEHRYPQSIMVINCEKNGKQGTARNIGLQYASSNYICFIDSDDWIDSHAFELMYQKAIQYNCDVVACGFQDEPTRNPSSPNPTEGRDQFYIVENDTDRGAFFGVNLGMGVLGNLFRRTLLTDNNICFPEGIFYEDEYWYSLVLNYITRAYVVNQIFYHYYLRPNSTIHTCNSSHQLDRAYVEELKLQELINRGIFDRFPEIYEHEFILHYYMQMCYVLFVQFDIIQYDTIRMLHDNTYKLFPNYKNNLFVKRILMGKGGDFMREMYEALAEDFTDTRIDELCMKCRSDDGTWIDICI